MNKLIISSTVLKPVLNKLGQAVNQKTVVPALKNILIKVSGKYCELITSDLELTILQRCDCEASSDFEMMLPYDIVTKVVAFNPDCPLQFISEKKSVKIIGHNDVFEIKKLEAVSSFPKLPDMPEGSGVTIKNEHINVLKAALQSIGKDDSKPVFTRVLMEMRTSGITIVSTDANICFTYAFVGVECPVDDDLLLSSRLIKSIIGTDELSLLWNDKFIVFKSKDSTIFFTRSELRYAAWRTIIPKDYPSNLQLNRTDLVNALEKCSLSSEERKDASINLADKQLIRFSATDKEMGLNVSASVSGNYTGEVESITLLSDKMLRLVQQVDYSEVDLAIHHKDRAVLVRSKEDENYLGLIMPVTDN